MAECRVNLLPDDPSREDLFGPHQRVARAIARMVREETGKKAIALEGTWGSGKSTTVRLLRAELESDAGKGESPSATVFSFDAWAHRGDPLRRSFIEELAAYLVTIGWIDENDWKEEIEELREQRETFDITSSPRLTGVGKVMVILLLLMPLGYVQLTTDNPLWGARGLGVLLALAPVLVGVGTWAFWGIARFLSKKFSLSWGPLSDDGHEDIESDVLALFLNKVRTVEETTKLRTPDPTSIEFRRFFSRLLDDALADQSRRLVLAIDNLDRIEADEALTIWSTMRTFFEFGSDPSREWVRRFWLLVPYDKDSLRKLWQAEFEGNEEENGEEEDQEKPKRARQHVGQTAVEAFIDKSFQVRFRVSPPVLSDWRRFFDTQFTKAFPDHDSDRERYSIAQIYRRSRQSDDGNITPRDIILFLNQIGALHRQWSHEEVSLEEEALYSAFQKKISGRKSLVSASFIPPELLTHRDTTNLGRKMAALEYGVKPSKALQVAMGEPIELALTEGNIDEIDDFRGAPGLPQVLFDTVLRNVVDWRRAQPNGLSHTATLLNELGDDLPATIRDSLWRMVRRELPAIDEWPNFYSKSASGLLKILEETPVEERAEIKNHLLKVVSASCPSHEDDGDGGHIEDWIEGGATLLEGLIAEVDAESPTLRVPGTAERFLQVVRIVRKRQSKLDVRHRFLPVVSPEDVREELERAVQEGDVDEETYKDVRFLDRLDKEWDWSSLGSTVANTLRANNDIDVALIGSLVPLLEELARTGSVPGKHLPQQTEGGHLFHRLYQANQANDAFAKAACLHSLLVHNPSGNRTSNPGNASSGQNLFTQVRDNPDSHPEVVEKVSDLLLEFDYAKKLFEEDGLTEEAPKLSRALLTHLLQQPEALQHLDLSQVASVIHPRIRDAIPDLGDRETVWRTLAEQGKLFDQLQRTPVEESTAELHSEAYRTTQGLSGSEKYEDYLRRRLGALPEETWENQLANEGALLGLLRQLVEQNVPVKMPVDFSDALRTHFRKVVRGEIKPSDDGAWTELLEVLEDSHRDVLLNDLVSLLNLEEEGHKHIGLQMYGDALLDDPSALTSEGNRVLTSLIPDLLEEQDPEGLKWVERFLDGRSDIVENASVSARRTLKDKLTRLLERLDSNSETFESVVGIAHSLGVESPQRQESDSKGPAKSEQEDDSNDSSDEDG